VNNEQVWDWKEALLTYLKVVVRNSPEIERHTAKFRIIFLIVHMCNRRLKCKNYSRF
jgi:hypothetical protein